MSILFPSNEFFTALQASMNADPKCTRHLEPSEAYCGFAIGDRLFVLEFDGRECSAVVTGGNELDLDFVIAGPAETWKGVVEAVEVRDVAKGLPTLVEKGELEVRSVDNAGVESASEALAFLQVFLEQGRGLDLEFD